MGTETVVDAVKLKYKVASQMFFSFVELFVDEKFSFLSHEHVVTNFLLSLFVVKVFLLKGIHDFSKSLKALVY